MVEVSAGRRTCRRVIHRVGCASEKHPEAAELLVDDALGEHAHVGIHGWSYAVMLGRETYDNGVRKAIYGDPDGNEIGIGGPPSGASSTG